MEENRTKKEYLHPKIKFNFKFEELDILRESEGWGDATDITGDVDFTQDPFGD